MPNKQITELEDYLDEIGYKYPPGVNDTVEATMELIKNLLLFRSIQKDKFKDILTKLEFIFNFYTRLLSDTEISDEELEEETCCLATACKDVLEDIEKLINNKDANKWLWGVEDV